VIAGVAIAVVKVVITLAIFDTMGICRTVKIVTAPILDAVSTAIQFLSRRTGGAVRDARVSIFMVARIAVAVVKVIVTLAIGDPMGVGRTVEINAAPIFNAVPTAIQFLAIWAAVVHPSLLPEATASSTGYGLNTELRGQVVMALEVATGAVNE